MTTAAKRGAASPARDSLLSRVSALGAVAQASVPGIYAWGVTVAPCAWSRGAPVAAKVAALAGVGALLAGIVLEHKRALAARATAVWGLLATSAIVWILAPTALAPLHLDAPRGVAGMFGWALFALASAAPAIRPAALRTAPDTAPRLVEAAPLRPRSPVHRGDAVFIASAIIAAVVLQTIGWQIKAPERALLVRLSTLACALALIGGATAVSLARQERPNARAVPRLRIESAPTGRRITLRALFPWLAAVAVLTIGGALLYAR